jgi:hypothetical protein
VVKSADHSHKKKKKKKKKKKIKIRKAATGARHVETHVENRANSDE